MLAIVVLQKRERQVSICRLYTLNFFIPPFKAMFFSIHCRWYKQTSECIVNLAVISLASLKFRLSTEIMLFH